MALKRPKRHDYNSEPAWLLACLRFLDARHPGREGQRARIAAFARWTQPLTDQEVEARLIALWRRHSRWTDADRREWAALAEIDRERDATCPRHSQKKGKS